MSVPNTSRWIATGLMGLPLYGLLTLFSSVDPQPDPNTHYEAWARFVTTDAYVLKHLFLTVVGTILGIFGTIALGVYLAAGRSGRMALSAMVLTVLGYSLFLTWGGASTFAAPLEGQAYLAGIRGIPDLPHTLVSSLQLATMVASILFGFLGNVLLGLAVWRSGTLPKWAGALWAFSPVLMYVFGLVYAMTIGAQATPPTVPAGAALLVIAGIGIAWPAFKGPARTAAAVEAPASA